MQSLEAFQINKTNLINQIFEILIWALNLVRLKLKL
jgi:hypothetical protein